MQVVPPPLGQSASVGDADKHEVAETLLPSWLTVCALSHLLAPQGDGKHLFIILCIVSQSIILITSFHKTPVRWVYLITLARIQC